MNTLRTISLYNTLTHKVEPIVPRIPGIISLYTCGPTVYNTAHIGNLKTFLFQDLMKRAFLSSGYKVRHCMNITDVEDKIINSSQKNVDINTANDERHNIMHGFTKHYITEFFNDLSSLNIIIPNYTPKATECIDSIINIIKELEKKGLAYIRNNSVYYRINNLPNYGYLTKFGKLANTNDLVIDIDEYERDSVRDFVLWKAAKPGEPWWESPWGKGRPGWHIECSAMGIEVLGEYIDIHSGGIDLVFPHHENEIAQSEGYLGHKWVTSWVHGAFLLIDGEKMSKKLGNCYTLRDLISKGFSPKAFRFAIQSNNYRKILNFSFKSLVSAESTIKRVQLFRKNIENSKVLKSNFEIKSSEITKLVCQAKQNFWNAIGNDLNTSEALSALFGIINNINIYIKNNILLEFERKTIVDFLDETNSIFACWPQENIDISQEVLNLIEKRKSAKVTQDWAEADNIRNILKNMGIIIEDKKDGTVTWYFKN